jgi:DNA invertase Pin-like site-specific DNA recombinase
MELLSEMESNNIKHLYVWNNDRLSRHNITQQTLRVALQRNQVTLYTKDGKFDLALPEDQLFKTLLDGVAQYDNAIRAERSRIGKLNTAKRGQWHGGPPPFGYKLSNKKLVIEQEEARWVVRIFDGYSNGMRSTQVKQMLDENGVSPRRKKGTWAKGSITSLMANTHYKGTYTYVDGKTGEEVPVECPRIVEDTLWFSTQAKKTEALKHGHQTNRTSKFYLLRDLMVCGHCGERIRGRINPTKRDNKYFCSNKERVYKNTVLKEEDKWKRGTGCGMDRSLNIPKTDASVWNGILEVVKNSNILKERVKREVLRQKDEIGNINDEKYKSLLNTDRKLKERLRKVEESISKVETDHMLGKTKTNIYKGILQNLTDEMGTIEAELAQVELQKQEIASDRRWYDWVKQYEEDYLNAANLSDDDKKAYIEALVSQIEVKLNSDTKQHNLEILFKLPVVEDQLIWNDPKKKSLGYELKEGNTQFLLVDDFREQVGVKKKKMSGVI